MELALEGHRLWDLIRTKNAEKVLGKLGFKVGVHDLLPIPQSEIDLSKGILIQHFLSMLFLKGDLKLVSLSQITM